VRWGETLEAVSRASSPRRLATGIPAVDALLQGGFPAGYLCEIAGPPSSGRTSLALSLLAHTTARTGELAAVVDRADSFDPSSAEAAGVDLERVLWARTPSEWRAALRCVERLLQTEGIPLILLEWIQPGPTIPAAAWTRLVRLAAGTRSALIVLNDQRLTGSQAHMVLEMQPTHPRFTGRPPLLEEIGARARLVRHRTGPPGRAVDLRLGATPPGRSHSAFHSPSHSPSG